jgi:hypothetical protein
MSTSRKSLVNKAFAKYETRTNKTNIKKEYPYGRSPFAVESEKEKLQLRHYELRVNIVHSENHPYSDFIKERANAEKLKTEKRAELFRALSEILESEPKSETGEVLRNALMDKFHQNYGFFGNGHVGSSFQHWYEIHPSYRDTIINEAYKTIENIAMSGMEDVPDSSCYSNYMRSFMSPELASLFKTYDNYLLTSSLVAYGLRVFVRRIKESLIISGLGDSFCASAQLIVDYSNPQSRSPTALKMILQNRIKDLTPKNPEWVRLLGDKCQMTINSGNIKINTPMTNDLNFRSVVKLLGFLLGAIHEYEHDVNTTKPNLISYYPRSGTSFYESVARLGMDIPSADSESYRRFTEDLYQHGDRS